MLHVVYESAPGTTVDWCATDKVRLPGFEVTENAEEGAVAQSQILVEDSGGALDIVGMKRWWAYEDAEEDGNKIIASGFVGDREIGRDAGGPEPFLIDADRRWSVGLVDKEATLSDRVLTGSFADRPAETDIARLTALLASGFVPNVTNSLGYIDTSNAVNLSASPFRGQRAYDLISDCAQQSNKNFFLVKASESTTTGVSTWSLWYAFDYHAQYTSSLRLTNIKADVDNTTTFAVDPDMILRRTPERVYSGVLVRYNNGEVYQQDIDTGNSFRFRDAVHPGVNVADASVAAARGLRYLADADAEEDRITCRFVVPKESVNGLRAGQRIQFRFSHLPGYSTSEYAYARCVRRTVRQLSDSHYEIKAELVPAGGGATTASRVRVMRPNGNYAQGSYVYLVGWSYDGENYQAGDNLCLPGGAADPAVGFLALYPQTSKPANGWEGAVVTGDGLIDITLNGISCSGVSDGASAITLTLEVDGAVVATATYSDGTAGLHAQSYGNMTVSASDVSVRSGDIIKLRLAATGGWTGAFVIPSGVGECINNMRVTGDLR